MYIAHQEMINLKGYSKNLIQVSQDWFVDTVEMNKQYLILNDENYLKVDDSKIQNFLLNCSALESKNTTIGCSTPKRLGFYGFLDSNIKKLINFESNFLSNHILND